MGILEGPNLGDIAQYSRTFRLRRQQFQGAYGASRHTAPHATSVAAEALGRARAGTEAKDGAEKTVAEPEKVRRLEQVVAELQLHS